MRILIASSEVVPFAKSGGLADVCGALPPALAARGHDVRVVMPLHRSVDMDQHHLLPVMKELDVYMGSNRFKGRVLRTVFPGTSVPVYFIQNDTMFDRAGLYGEGGEDYEDNPLRYAFFCIAAIWMLRGLDWAPDVIQVNDWQTALMPVYMHHWENISTDPFYRDIRVLLTIHNLAYQGSFDPAMLPEIGIDWSLFRPDALEFYDQVNPLKGGLVFADHLSTVSPTYAREIQTESLGSGLEGTLRSRADSLTGILNGIDTEVWDPSTDEHLPAKYSAEDLSGKAACKAALQRELGLPERSDAPLFGVISRLAEQKGFDLLESCLPSLLGMDLQIAVLGTGDPRFRQMLEKAAAQNPERIAARFVFDEGLAHRIEAGCDLFLMPSRYEPCGLNQMYSLRYGTVPIVRKTGGLSDTVVNAKPSTLRAETATGFVFNTYTPGGLMKAIHRALALRTDKPKEWQALIRRGMAQDFSWDASARAYEALFEKMVGSAR